MPYLNLDHGFANHPKVLALSDAAFRLHVRGMCYCATYLTDGILSPDAIAALNAKPRPLRELLAACMWNELPGGDIEVHDYLEWNRSREWWSHKRSTDRSRQARKRRRDNDESR